MAYMVWEQGIMPEGLAFFKLQFIGRSVSKILCPYFRIYLVLGWFLGGHRVTNLGLGLTRWN